MSTAAALVVHDLKNELGALEASLERLAQRPEAAAAEAAHRQCQALRQRLVMYLTLYGGGELRAQAEDESPLELLQSLAARHAPATQVRLAAEPPPFWFYDRRLVQMTLEAALHNALQHGATQIELGLRVDAGELVFTVDDDGRGLDPARPAPAHATGLGTALCQAVAAAHGGAVRLSNRAGGGARFELSLAT